MRSHVISSSPISRNRRIRHDFRPCVEALERRDVPTPLHVVNTPGELGDFDLNDGVADSDPDLGGLQTTLAAAFDQANADGEADVKLEIDVEGAMTFTASGQVFGNNHTWIGSLETQADLSFVNGIVFQSGSYTAGLAVLGDFCQVTGVRIHGGTFGMDGLGGKVLNVGVYSGGFGVGTTQGVIEDVLVFDGNAFIVGEDKLVLNLQVQQGGLEVEGNGNELRDCTVTDGWADVQADDCIVTRLSVSNSTNELNGAGFMGNNNQILDSDFSHNPVFIGVGTGTLFQGNVIHDVTLSTDSVLVIANGGNHQIVSNTFSGTLEIGLDSPGNLIKDNKFILGGDTTDAEYRHQGIWIPLGSTSPNTRIEHNEIRGYTFQGITILGGTHDVLDNLIDGQNALSVTGIGVLNSGQAKIENNTVVGNQWGIELETPQNEVLGNTVMNNVVGIWANSDDNTLTGNNVRASAPNGGNGVSISGNHNVANGNMIANNVGGGVVIGATSSFNTLISNRIYNQLAPEIRINTH